MPPSKPRTPPSWSSLVLLCTATGLAQCGKAPPPLRDTEGRTFVARCDEKACSVRQSAGPERAGGDVQLERHRRVLTICDAGSGAAEPDTRDCRPLVCASDSECPPLPAGVGSTCLGGVCQDTAIPLAAEDSVALCMAGTGLGHDAPKQIQRFALGLNCGSPCTVPALCRQP